MNTTTTARITGARYGITPDDRDEAILHALVAEWDEVHGPRVGDFLRFGDGTLRRFTYDHGPEHGIQTTARPGFGESFYFGHGYMSFSGGLDSCVPHDAITPTNETREGSAWFFHHGCSGAHRSVYVSVPCRVFETERLPRY